MTFKTAYEQALDAFSAEIGAFCQTLRKTAPRCRVAHALSDGWMVWDRTEDHGWSLYWETGHEAGKVHRTRLQGAPAKVRLDAVQWLPGFLELLREVKSEVTTRVVDATRSLQVLHHELRQREGIEP